ncbi:AAA family ATPase [Erysipelotrichaceae bacterium HCN-30851]
MVNLKKPIPVGLKSYEKMKQRYYTVDKTLMIADFLERGNEVTLITRPRRFGKTINMSMMTEFFDITKDSRELFQDTAIMKTEYASEINQYPTIFISFANAKGDKADLVKNIKYQLRDEYDRLSISMKAEMTEFEEDEYKNIKESLLSVNDGNINNVSNALSFLMSRMEKYYGKRVMVFIDEYDTPFVEAHVNGFYDEIRSGLASMLHNALKTSGSLQYAMLTGIQRVAKENIFSDLNNLVVCTVKDKEYAEYFGFTEKETKGLLEYYDLKLNDEVKQMYDGYHFGDFEIYNPWSIINYASRKILEPYWVNTSSNMMIRKAMEDRDSSFDRGYEKLIETGKLETTVYMETSFFEVNITENLWGLLVNAGYLTLDEIIGEGEYVLRIPNQEVQKEFQSLTAFYLNVTGTDLNGLFNALRRLRKEDFIDKYQNILLTLPSYHDLKDENSYHVLFLGMCAWLNNDYEIISNKEEGKGRADIILKAKKNSLPSYIFEFKYLKEDMDKDGLKKNAKKAVEQIREKQYDAGLQGKVIYIGLAHHGKDAIIEWQER